VVSAEVVKGQGSREACQLGPLRQEDLRPPDEGGAQGTQCPLSCVLCVARVCIVLVVSPPCATHATPAKPPLSWLACAPFLWFRRSHTSRAFHQMKLITPSAVSERLKVNGSLARKALKHLMAEGLIREVAYHSAQSIYTRATNASAEA